MKQSIIRSKAGKTKDPNYLKDEAKGSKGAMQKKKTRSSIPY